MPAPRTNHALIRSLIPILAICFALSFFMDSAWAAGSISGQITRDSDGTGISGIAVNFYTKIIFSGNYFYGSAGSTTTDATGNYVITGLAANTYYVGTSNNQGYVDEYYNGKATQSASDPVEVPIDVNVTNINIGLALGGSISGQVTRDLDGAGISGVSVTAYNTSWGSIKSGTTDSSGYYTLSGIPAGSIYLQAANSSYLSEYYNNATAQNQATSVAVAAGETTSGINISLSLGGIISGRVVRASDGSGISGINVNFYNSGLVSLGYFWSTGSATTDSDGYYSKSGFAAASYYVRTNNSSGYGDLYYSGKASLTTADAVVVADNATITNIDFSLAPGGSISGRVTRTSDGSGIPSLSISLYDSNTISASIKSATTDASGNYTFSNLAAGSYYLLANSTSYINQYYSNAVSLKSATPVIVMSGAGTTDINFSLTIGGIITGRVTRASDSVGLSGLTVNAFDAGWASVKSATTDSNGNYSIGGLPSGYCYVGFTGNSSYAGKYYINAGARYDAIRVSVTQGVTTPDINLQLALGRSISGRVVRESDGAGIAGVTVRARPNLGFDTGWSATTDAQGYYIIPNLAPRQYFVQTVNSQGYVDEYIDDAEDWGATPVAVIAETDTTNVNFSLLLGGVVTGKVAIDLPTGAGVSGVLIIFSDANGDIVTAVNTDASGNYRTGALKPGNYYVGLSSWSSFPNFDQYFNDSITRSGATPVTVVQAVETNDISFITPSGGSISGKVNRNPDGAELSGITIRAFDDGWKLIKSASTDAFGNYHIAGLAPGKYYVGHNDKTYVDQYCCEAATRSTAAAITVKQGLETIGVEFSLTASDVGSISGRVAANVDGASLSGVTVYVSNENWETIRSTTTDSLGNYSLTGLPAGSYYVGTRVNRYADKYYDGSTGAIHPDEATPLAVVAGTNTPNINFGLNSGMSIQGLVFRNEFGTVIPGVYVDAYNSSGALVSYGRTDAGGNYYIEGLEPGQYYLKTRNNIGYMDEYHRNALTQDTATPVNLIEEIHVTNFTLSGGGSISGRVTRDTDGSALPGIKVIAHDANWTTRTGFAITDANGDYSIQGLAPGSYYLKTSNNSGGLDEYFDGVTYQSSATAINLTAGQNVTNKNFILSFGGSISGTITRNSDGLGIAGVTVGVFDENWNAIQGVPTDSMGDYSVTGLPAGDYYLRAITPNGYQEEFYNNVQSDDNATKVSVTLGAATTGIDFGITEIGSISGRLVRNSDGLGIEGIDVQAYDTNWNYIASSPTDALGDYSITGLAIGNYYIRTASSSTYINEYYSNSNASVLTRGSATAVAVSSGVVTTDINFGLEAGAGSISGQITNESTGVGVPGLTVIVYRLFDASSLYVATATTDGDGNFTIPGLASGNYYLKTSASAYINEYYPDGASSSGATAIVVAQDANTALNVLALTKKGSISGRVTDAASGAGIAGATINVFKRLISFTIAATGTTDAQGYYQINNIDPGYYYPEANNTNAGYTSELYDNAGYWNATAVLVESGSDTPNINYQLSLGQTVSGRVTRDTDQTGVSGVSIMILNSGDMTGGFATTDSNGNYSLTGIRPGQYILNASGLSGYVGEYYNNAATRSGATPVTVTQGVDLTNMNFSLASDGIGSGTGSISGTLARNPSDSGSGGYNVVVYDEAWRTVKSSSGLFFGSSVNYSVSGLPAGNYYVGFTDANFYGFSGYSGYMPAYYAATTTLSRSAAELVSVQDGAATTDINITLGAGGSISGRVIRASDGTGIANAMIKIYDSQWKPIGNDTTDASGYYGIRGFTAGAYYLRTSTNGYADNYYNGSLSGEDVTIVQVGQDEAVADINFSLGAGLAINGNVSRSSDETPLQGVQVDAYDSNWQWVGADITDANGGYSIEGLTIGDYYVGTQNSLGYVDEYSHNVATPGAATIVTLVEVERPINFHLDKTITPGDFNGDGNSDILWRNTLTGEIFVWFMDGSVKSDAALIGSVDLAWRIAALADFNGDNRTDIFYRNATTGENYVWYMNGTTVADAGLFPTVSDQNWKVVGAADFNHDEKIDVLWRNLSTGENYIWYLDGTAVTGSDVLPTVADQSWEIVGAADFNNDDSPDILWRNASSGDNYVWYLNGVVVTGSGSIPAVSDLNWKIVGIVDFNNDGEPDILWRNGSTGSNYIWYLNGVELSGAASLEPVTGANWLPYDVGDIVHQSSGSDFNNDGKPDILWRNISTGENYLWYMDETSVTEAGSLPTVTDQDWQIVGIADFNNDGKPDVLWRNIFTGENYLWYMDEASVTEASSLPTVTDQDWQIVGVADFNADGKVDVLWRNVSTGDNYVWHMDGTAVTGSSALPTVADQDWQIVGIADFNADGKVDVLWRNVSTGEDYVWYMNGTTVTGSGVLPTVADQNWQIVGIADFNADGNTDILWRNVSAGDNYLWYMDGVTVTGGGVLPTVEDQNWTIVP